MESTDKEKSKSKPTAKEGVSNPFATLTEAKKKIAIKKDPNAITKVSKERINAITKLIEKAAETGSDEIKFSLYITDDDYKFKDVIINFLAKAKWKLQERHKGQLESVYIFKSVSTTKKEKHEEEEDDD
jgi:hypothetical protein